MNIYLLYGTCIPVKLNNKWGIIDKDGNKIVPIEYDGFGCREVTETGFGNILDEWRKYSITLNREVLVKGIKESYVGKAVDIDADGALLVESEGQLKTVLAGDVSIRMR